MEFKNPYHISDIEQFFNACAVEVDTKLKTLPDKAVFNTEEVVSYLTSVVGSNPDFAEKWDKVKDDLDINSDGFICELENRINKIIGA